MLTGLLLGVKTIAVRYRYQKANVMYCLIFTLLQMEIIGPIYKIAIMNGSNEMDLVYVGVIGMA